MKKYFLFIAVFLFSVVLFSSCIRYHDVSISISDDEDVYRMKALYDEHKTKAVQRRINKYLKENNSMSFVNSSIDADITLDDGTSFYVVSRPGKLKIKMDRTENSEEAYDKVKEMCEEIKDLLAGKEDHE